MQNSVQRVSRDKFDQNYTVVGCKPNRKNRDFNQGYVKLKGQLYKIEVSPAKKDDIKYWVRVTEVKENKRSM